MGVAKIEIKHPKQEMMRRVLGFLVIASGTRPKRMSTMIRVAFAATHCKPIELVILESKSE
jgi:hypothetical protein